jgi:hypothetical protein
MSATSPEELRRRKRSLAGFAAAKSDHEFILHIVDDAGAVFEIEVSQENLELMIADMTALLSREPKANSDSSA